MISLQTLPARIVNPVPEVKPEFLPLVLSGQTAAISLDKVRHQEI